MKKSVAALITLALGVVAVGVIALAMLVSPAAAFGLFVACGLIVAFFASRSWARGRTAEGVPAVANAQPTDDDDGS